MKKSRPALFDWGLGDSGQFCTTMSCGRLYTYCVRLQVCTLEYAKQCSEYGLSHLNNSYSDSGEVGSEYFWSTERGKDQENDCCHRTHGGFNYPMSGVIHRTASPANGCVFNHYRVPPSIHDVASLEKHPDLDLSVAQRTAWHAMQPEFEGNVSMLNFIFELKDFRSIVKAMRNKPFKSLTRNFRKWKKQRLLKRIDPSRPIAEAHLVNEFAIKPLISDIIQITADLNTIVREAQQQFSLDGLEANVRHHSTDFVHVESGVPYGYFHHVGQLEYTRFTANLKYTYRYSMRSQWDAMKRYWGLNLNAEVVWNALPFSFLVDYFYKVGNTIALLDHDPNVKLKIHAYSESLLSVRHEGVYWEGSGASAPLLVNNREAEPLTPVSGTKAELYTRRITAPNRGTVLPPVAMPSKGQWTNGVALLRALL